MKKAMAVLVSAILAAGVFSGCAATGNDSGSSRQNSAASSPSSASRTEAGSGIATSGSTALQPLLQKAIAPFKVKNASFKGTITIGTGGSGQGISDVKSGTVQIGDSDVAPEDIGSDSAGLVDHKVCVVAVGVAVSKNVSDKLKDISTADLKSIFNGTYTDWKQVKGWTGGSLPIQVFYRKSNSGTRVLFEKYGSGVALKDSQLASFQNFTKKESSGDLQTAINTASSKVGAIGYESLPYCMELKLLTVNGKACTYDNVYTGSYPVWGYEHMITKGTPSADVAAFIDFVSSADFSQIVTESGYGLISSMKTSR